MHFLVITFIFNWFSNKFLRFSLVLWRRRRTSRAVVALGGPFRQVHTAVRPAAHRRRRTKRRWHWRSVVGWRSARGIGCIFKFGACISVHGFAARLHICLLLIFLASIMNLNYMREQLSPVGVIWKWIITFWSSWFNIFESESGLDSRIFIPSLLKSIGSAGNIGGKWPCRPLNPPRSPEWSSLDLFSADPDPPRPIQVRFPGFVVVVPFSWALTLSNSAENIVIIVRKTSILYEKEEFVILKNVNFYKNLGLFIALICIVT